MLQKHILNDCLRHAYLICGPAGVGRRTLALRFVQALNCERSINSAEPCLQCRKCKQIEAMVYADLLVVQLDETHEKVLVEQIRDLQRNLSLHPYEGHYKVALLRNFDLATESTENSLLKTLEEPPDNVILIITAENPEMLAPTVVSRCEILRLRPVSIDKLAVALEDILGFSSHEAQLMALIAAGLPGRALRLASSNESRDNRSEDLHRLFSLLGSNVRKKIDYSQTIGKRFDQSNGERARLRDMLGIWLSFWRDVMVVGHQTSVPIYNPDFSEQVSHVAQNLDLHSVVDAIQSIEKGISLLDRNVNTRLVLEVLLMDIPFILIQENPV